MHDFLDSTSLAVDVTDQRHRRRVCVLCVDVHGRYRVVARHRAAVETTVVGTGERRRQLSSSAVQRVPSTLRIEAQAVALLDSLDTLILVHQLGERPTELGRSGGTEVGAARVYEGSGSTTAESDRRNDVPSPHSRARYSTTITASLTPYSRNSARCSRR